MTQQEKGEDIMLFLFVSVIIFVLCLCGTGCLFARILGYSSPHNPLVFFWLGFSVVSALSMLVSLFVPINLLSLIVFFVLGVVGLPFFYGECKKAATQFDSSEKKIFIFLSFLVVVVITCLGAYSSWSDWAYDTDLYHAQIIRWYNEYGTPPGLGNLHTRLAHNSSLLSLAALFDNGIWDARSAWIMPALLLLGGIFYCLNELIFSRRNGTRLYVLCILLWIGLKIGFGSTTPSLYYDTPVHIVNAIIILEAYYILAGYNGNLSKKRISAISILIVISVGAFMIKPIGAVSLLFSGLLALYLLVRNRNQTIYSWFIIFAPALCALAIWVTKNIFLSGYPLYPLPMFAMPFDWTMSFESVEGNYLSILAWARKPDPDCWQSLEYGFLFWFIPWLINNLKSQGFLMLAVLPSLLSILFWFFVIRYVKTKKALYFFIWTIFSIVYWFITAPDIRFGDGFFWVWLGTAFLFLASDGSHFSIANFWKNQKIRIAFFYFWTLGTLGGIGFTIMSPVRSLFFIGTIPSRQVKEYIVDTVPPFSVWIPIYPEDYRTGNSPLPSTPFIASNLEMREPGNLGKGFKVRQH
jgi:hypothetical protein